MESNQRHKAFQASALPTELSSHASPWKKRNYIRSTFFGFSRRRSFQLPRNLLVLYGCVRLLAFQNKCMPTLFILAGATASGKTELALHFAQKENCEILSCDASAFYRGMDIGTAKPTPEEQRTVRHWGIDIAEPNEPFSIKDFVA